MPDPLSLPLSLALTLGAAALVSLWIHLRLPALLDDPAGLARLRGMAGRRPGGLITCIAAGSGAVLAWLAAFFVPTALSRGPADIPLLLICGLLAGATGWLMWVDFGIHRLPNRIVLPLTGAGIVLALASVLIGVGLPGDSLHGGPAGAAAPALHGLLGGAGMLLLFILLNVLGAVLGQQGMGGGDVKLAVLVGMLPAMITPAAALLALLVMNGSALVHVVFRALVHRDRARDPIAFGPHMLIGTWTAVICAPVLL